MSKYVHWCGDPRFIGTCPGCERDKAEMAVRNGSSETIGDGSPIVKGDFVNGSLPTLPAERVAQMVISGSGNPEEITKVSREVLVRRRLYCKAHGNMACFQCIMKGDL